MSKKQRIKTARRAKQAMRDEHAQTIKASNKAAKAVKNIFENHFGKLVAATLFVGIMVNVLVWFSPNNTIPATDPATQLASTEVLALGERRYAEVCASCHGSRGQGYANPALPAPALNGSEHAWHHSDAQIRGWMRNGYMNMPAVPGSWRDEDIDAALAYLKQWWTPEQRAFQASR